MKTTSKHPFEPFIPVGAKSLIIGTIPPQRFCIEEMPLKENDVNFYYGSSDNYFWEMINDINSLGLEFKNTEKAIEERKSFLESMSIGITDIIETCIHDNGSASDKDLKDIQPKNLNELLEKNSQIDTLIYTSDFVKKLLNDYYKTYHHTVKNADREFQLKVNGKTYNVIVLYSPSPQALRGMRENGKEVRLKQYEEVFKK